jgi:hypothetical protein
LEIKSEGITVGSGTGTPVAQGAPASFSPDANPQSNLPLENLSLTAPPPGQEFNTPGEGFVTQTASELGIPDFDRGEFIFNPDLGGSEAQQRELFEFSADTFVPIFRDIALAPPPPQGDDIIFDAFDPPTPTPGPPQTAEQRRQDDILVQLGKLGSNLNRVQAAEQRTQQRQSRGEIPNLGQNTPNPLAQIPESVISTLIGLGNQNNPRGEVQVAGGESKTFPSVPDRRPQGRLDRLRQEQAEKARIREAFGRNPSGLETLRFNNPRLDKVFTTLGADPLFIGNQTRVIDGRLTPVPVRRRAEGGLVAPMPRPRPEMPMAPMPRPRPEGLAATPEGEESFSFGFSLDDVNDYVNRVLSGDIVSENLRNMFSSGGGEEKVTEEVEIASSPNSLVEDLATTIKSYEGPAILKATKPVKDDPFTIGYGRTRDLEGNPITKGTTTTQEEAEIMLQEDIALRLPEIRRAYPNFDSYPRDLQVQIGQSYYRGTLTPGHSPKTRKLINQGKFKEAAKEFLDNKEYRTAKQRGRSGIRDRMEDVAKTLRNYGSRSS